MIGGMTARRRAPTYRFSITVTVEPGQDGYDDPEWLADAVWGVLVNVYGLECVYDPPDEVRESEVAKA
jgi:hypothetical protein